MATDSNLPETKKINVLALVSIATGGLGVFALLGSLLLSLLGAIPGVICTAFGGLLALAALVTGILGLIQVNRPENLERGKGLAIAGIVIGALALLAACLIPLLGGLFAGRMMWMHHPNFWQYH